MKKAIMMASAVVFWSVWGVTVTVVAPQAGASKAVTVGGKATMTYAAGATAPLKATANAGWAFAGWYESYDEASGTFSNEVALAQSADWRNPSANYVVGDKDATLYARFASPAEDSLYFDLAETFAEATETADDFDRPVLSLTNTFDLAVWFESLSLPTVTVKGLPSGLSFDKSSLRIYGKPKDPGVSKVEMSAKNASGYTFNQVLYVRVGNSASEHVEGSDSADFVVGEEVEQYLDGYFDIENTNATIKSVALTGLPSGLSLESETDGDDTYYYLAGTPKAAGDFVVVCKVTFTDGTTESASALFSVSGPDPDDYDVDFSALEGCAVGDSILAEDEVAIGEYDSEFKTGVTAVSGLPDGIAAKKVDSGDGTVLYVLSGMFKKAGEFTVSVKVAYEDWELEKIVSTTVSQKIIVSDAVGAYVSASLLDAELSQAKCKVAGSGVYAAGTTAKLTATTGSGYVFAGWCDSAGLPMSAATQDYRQSPLSVPVTPDMELDWYANFILKDDDYIDVSGLTGAEIEIDASSDEKTGYSFAVDSGSLPTLKFNNLPAGITCEPSSETAGEYVLSYDPTAKKKPVPGRYAVTATGTNASRMSDSANFTVTVLNYTDADIHVKDDYGVLTPNVEMTPISFSDAVDFARGDTLVVSGLPTGLKYDDKAASRMLSGIPTKPGNYTLTFAAKIVTEAVTNEATGRVTYTYRSATATAFIKVKDFPTIVATLSEEAATAGNKVSGTGSFKAGTKVTLKATAAKDWSFAGWSGVEGLAALNPTLAYEMGTSDLTEIGATFVHKRDDTLVVNDPGVVAVAKGAAFSTNLLELIETRSLPTVSVSGLPNGLKFDPKTFLLSGTVGKTVTAGYVYATVSAKNASGYTFVRVVKFAVLENVSDEIPVEPTGKNEADIDFSDLDGLVTGGFYPSDGVEAIGFLVNPAADAAVTAISVSGLPSGMKSATSFEGDSGEVVVFGTPNKPGRCTVKVQVTYSNRKKATSEYSFTVEDGGSGWLDVESFDAAMGTVSGAGVYASGASVKLGAKPAAGNVFAGWYEDEGVPFDVLAMTDGVDYRTAAASFIFRKEMFSIVQPIVFGGFVAKADDAMTISGLDDVWEIVPSESGEWPFTVESASLPKLTVTGLPKGVTLDAASGRLVYSRESQAVIVPGYYTVTFKAVNQSNVSVTEKMTVFVANKTTDEIGGLNPDADAYPLYAGVSLDPTLIMPEIDVTNGWKLSVSGLPTGLSLKSEKDVETGATYYYIAGIATKAGTNTVTFTATKGTAKEVATITIGVSALPAWACGTYDGAYFVLNEAETNAVGQITMTASAAGKVSGKILKGGKSYSFDATSYAGYDSGSDTFWAEVVVPWSAADKETFRISVGHDESGLGFALLEPVGDGAYFAEAVQNAWLRKDRDVPVFATGAKQPVLQIGDIVCKFGTSGAVTVAGTIKGLAVTGKSQTLFESNDGNCVYAWLVICVSNSKLEGGVYCDVIKVRLSDKDGDDKLDLAEQR